jgi:hypothetical protein
MAPAKKGSTKKETQSTTIEVIPMTKDEVREEVFNTAAEMVERELEAMDVLNQSEVCTKVAEFLGLESHELFFFMEYGFEELQRRYAVMAESEEESRSFSHVFSDVFNKENEDPTSVALPATPGTPVKVGSKQQSIKQAFHTPEQRKKE